MKVDAKVNVLCRMHYDVDEVHAGHLKVRSGVVCHEILDKFLEAVLFGVGLLEVVDGLKDFYVAPFD